MAKFIIKCANERVNHVFEQIQKIAPSELPIHLYGETGTGKEVMAKTIHANSLVSKGPLITINCGAIEESILESELFGYANGAFTGANKNGYKGKIRLADNGTLFLDEINSMSLRMQTALLRVLEDKVIQPLGSEKEYPVQFRLITASSADLKELVKNEQFRRDLFYRIYVYPVNILPLRERKEDIELLIGDYTRLNQWFPKWLYKIIPLVCQYKWEGNIREFNNFLDRLRLLFLNIEPEEKAILEIINIGNLEDEKISGCRDTTFIHEKERVLQALEQNHYQLTKTANTLGVSRSTLYRKMKEYQLK